MLTDLDLIHLGLEAEDEYAQILDEAAARKGNRRAAGRIRARNQRHSATWPTQVAVTALHHTTVGIDPIDPVEVGDRHSITATIVR